MTINESAETTRSEALCAALWENAWAEFVPFLSFDVEIRKVICSTDVIGQAGQVRACSRHREWQAGTACRAAARA
ncbi:transposase, partial [Streptomyces violascens]|uniref:transposase n=1 Tax=Streptomyces violascens TaxID=67381 RepID=UPI0037B22069